VITYTMERIGDGNTSGALCLILGGGVLLLVGIHFWGKR
jgi:hypothetical protein